MWIANGSDEKTYAFLMTFCIISSFLLSIFSPLANHLNYIYKIYFLTISMFTFHFFTIAKNILLAFCLLRDIFFACLLWTSEVQPNKYFFLFLFSPTMTTKWNYVFINNAVITSCLNASLPNQCFYFLQATSKQQQKAFCSLRDVVFHLQFLQILCCFD